MESDNVVSIKIDGKNKIKSVDIFNSLKADYFLQKVFNNLERIRSLNIVKYNKNIKKRINLNINDYKEFSEKYSSIKVEIKPIYNKYGKFNNISEENEKYYQIYFNNKKEEIKRNYIKENEKIRIIIIIINYEIKSFKGLFENCDCIESIYFKKFHRNNINNMSLMFYKCSSLKELNLTNFNTNNVIDMSGMFSGCSSLKELNLTNFNTNNVIDMDVMFCGCSSLKELNLNNFNTNNVTSMSFMFARCLSLKELKINNFNTNNVKDMSYMFFNCSKLTNLSINNFNTNNVKYFRNMFKGCSNELKMQIETQYKNIKKEAFL